MLPETSPLVVPETGEERADGRGVLHSRVRRSLAFPSARGWGDAINPPGAEAVEVEAAGEATADAAAAAEAVLAAVVLHLTRKATSAAAEEAACTARRTAMPSSWRFEAEAGPNASTARCSAHTAPTRAAVASANPTTTPKPPPTLSLIHI